MASGHTYRGMRSDYISPFPPVAGSETAALKELENRHLHFLGKSDFGT